MVTLELSEDILELVKFVETGLRRVSERGRLRLGEKGLGVYGLIKGAIVVSVAASAWEEAATSAVGVFEGVVAAVGSATF